MSPLGSPLRAGRFALILVALLLATMALEVWGIHASISTYLH